MAILQRSSKKWLEYQMIPFSCKLSTWLFDDNLALPTVWVYIIFLISLNIFVKPKLWSEHQSQKACQINSRCTSASFEWESIILVIKLNTWISLLDSIPSGQNPGLNLLYQIQMFLRMNEHICEWAQRVL